MEDKAYGDKAVIEPIPPDSLDCSVEVGKTITRSSGSDHLQRKLNGKPVQLYGIGVSFVARRATS